MSDLPQEFDQATESQIKEKSDKNIANEAAQLFSDASIKYPNITSPQAAYVAKVCQTRGYNGEDVSLLGKTLLADDDRMDKLIRQAIAEHFRAAQSAPERKDRFPEPQEVRERMEAILGGTFELAQRMMILEPSEIQDILDQDAHFRKSIQTHGKSKRELYQRYVDERISDAEMAQEGRAKKLRRDQTKAERPHRRILGRNPRGRHAATENHPTSLTEQPAEQK
jgi:hypothetical protein